MKYINFAIGVFCLTQVLALDIGPTLANWYLSFQVTLDELKGILLSYDEREWIEISKLNLNEKFIDEFSEKVDWETISYYQNLTEYIMKKYEEKVDWYWIYELNKPIPSHMRKYLDIYFQRNRYDYLRGSYKKDIF